mmetsp:Transcript_13128/g.36926  ORF Transcript_13128/g.36926 Transcript_13128/m.36926 type:complete len:430 (-) Transcript_13128:1015-2304(-)|eukprot:CAMPEP_0172359810 /NCGR_PEP_ID=MMETSP1060-20121228/3942_1 /TAXON_ID=37318 /ORGANISM="Pseudo-nitzschia pungens, Strain cf. cingulata" /LENGTH=429 /DNA_ID=CAMNT_0013081597 /DNA_START=170 /DNA_END=1459 /DNA_ORIENTATION=+
MKAPNSNGLSQRSSRQFQTSLYHTEEKKQDSPIMMTRRKSIGIEVSPGFDDENPRSGYSVKRKLVNKGIPSAPNLQGNPRINGKRKSRSSSWMGWFMMIVTILIASGYFVVSYHERQVMLKQMEEQDAAMRELEVSLSMKFDAKIKALTKEKEELGKHYTQQKDWRVENQQLKDINARLEHDLKEKTPDTATTRKLNEVEEHARRLEGYNTHLKVSRKKMQENLQLLSKKAVIEKFGPEPYNVEIFVRFDSHKGIPDGGYITLELAPLDEMPHAVYWFLEQVDRKLYDGTSFHRNAGHVVQGGPSTNFLSAEGETREDQVRRFQDAGFHSILFQEYSPAFPHEKYTVGYAGRPGGPDFYISTQDNTKNHGPGGQSNYDDPSEADPCFAKIVHGIDVVDRMHQSPVKEGDYRAMERNVPIVHMKRIQHAR